MVHWELAGTALRAVFLQPSRVDELENIQVERAANRRQMNLIRGRGQLIFTVLPVQHRQGRDRVWEDTSEEREREREREMRQVCAAVTPARLYPSVLLVALIPPQIPCRQARAIKSPRWVLLGRWVPGSRVAAPGSPAQTYPSSLWLSAAVISSVTDS